jgi:hypothetical protein
VAGNFLGDESVVCFDAEIIAPEWAGDNDNRSTTMNLIRNLFGRSQNDNAPAPSAQDLEEAKRVFFEYAGNGLYMAQNDVHFEKYHISWEQQTAWRKEFVELWRSRLSTEDLTAIQRLRDADATEAIPDLLAMVDQGDSLARLRVAEALWALSYWEKDRALRKRAKETAVRSARSLVEQPIRVSDAHRAEIERLGGDNPEEYIILFARDVV